MTPKFIHYPKCSTCIKAAKWLKQNDIEVDARDIVTQNPTVQELSAWIAVSRLPVHKFFNTSGLRYKALNLKDVVKIATQQELIALLASEGMLVKRPILITESTVLLGFNEEVWAESLLK